MSEAYAETSQRLQKKLHGLKEKMVACEEYKALRREEDRMHIYDLATRIEQLLAPPPASITHEELKQVATTAGVDIVNYLPFLDKRKFKGDAIGAVIAAMVEAVIHFAGKEAYEHAVNFGEKVRRHPPRDESRAPSQALEGTAESGANAARIAELTEQLVEAERLRQEAADTIRELREAARNKEASENPPAPDGAQIQSQGGSVALSAAAATRALEQLGGGRSTGKANSKRGRETDSEDGDSEGSSDASQKSVDVKPTPEVTGDFAVKKVHRFGVERGVAPPDSEAFFMDEAGVEKCRAKPRHPHEAIQLYEALVAKSPSTRKNHYKLLFPTDMMRLMGNNFFRILNSPLDKKYAPCSDFVKFVKQETAELSAFDVASTLRERHLFIMRHEKDNVTRIRRMLRNGCWPTPGHSTWHIFVELAALFMVTDKHHVPAEKSVRFWIGVATIDMAAKGAADSRMEATIATAATSRVTSHMMTVLEQNGHSSPTAADTGALAVSAAKDRPQQAPHAQGQQNAQNATAVAAATSGQQTAGRIPQPVFNPRPRQPPAGVAPFAGRNRTGGGGHFAGTNHPSLVQQGEPGTGLSGSNAKALPPGVTNLPAVRGAFDVRNRCWRCLKEGHKMDACTGEPHPKYVESFSILAIRLLAHGHIVCP